MEKLLAIILGVFLVQQVGAQQIGTPDLSFYVNFTSEDGTPSNLDMWGECSYNKFIRIPYFIPNAPTFTNDLEVTLMLPSAPDSARLLEKKIDGSFEEEAEITNYFDQHFRLTKRQIQNLVKGDWYVEVDFGSNKYIGKLTPRYQFANRPTAVFDVLTPVFIHPAMVYRGYTVIAKDNQKADVVISGKKSIDLYYLPMEYMWKVYESESFAETITGPMLRHTFGVGDHYIGLTAHDTVADSREANIYLTVFTPAQAINYIMPAMGYLPVSQNKIENFTEQLSKASKYFDQGNMKRGRHELIAVSHQIEKLHSNDSASQWTLQYIQTLLECLD